MTKQEIKNLHNLLLGTAATIQTKAALAAAKAQEHKEAQEAKEIKRAEMLSEIANARFEVNNKLIYTNDDQRRAALIEAQTADADFQTIIAAEAAKAREKTNAELEAELHRKTFRANELLLLYYANNPAA